MSVKHGIQSVRQSSQITPNYAQSLKCAMVMASNKSESDKLNVAVAIIIEKPINRC